MTTIDRGTLGRQLQMIRGLYWGYGSNGDAYARLLCARDDDPRPLYRAMRESGVRRGRTEAWVIADHATARQVLDDPGFDRRSARTPEWMRAAGAPAADWAGPFQDVHAETWQGEIPDAEERAPDFADLLPAANERVDLVRDVAWPIALRGMDIDTRTLRRRAWYARVGLDAQLSPQQLSDTEAALAALPTDPTLRALFAAAELTADTVVDAILAIRTEPELVTRLADDPGIAPRIVAEVLRLHPTLHLERRTATVEHRLGEHTIAAGDEVAIVIAAANRDPNAFAEPDRFDIDRSDADRTLSAQRGHPGKLEELVVSLATAALRAAAEALPRLSVIGPVVRRRRSPVLRAVGSCPVEF